MPALHRFGLYREVPIAEILKVVNWSSKSTFERFYYRSEGSTAFTRAVLQLEPSSRYVICFKCKLVNTVPCIRSFRNTIPRFPEDKVHKGRMDCMRRWRIQGTVQSHPYVATLVHSTLPLYSFMEFAEEEDGDLEE